MELALSIARDDKYKILREKRQAYRVRTSPSKGVPQANHGLYLPMALAVTFPVNITIGMPLYLSLIQAGTVV